MERISVTARSPGWGGLPSKRTSGAAPGVPRSVEPGMAAFQALLQAPQVTGLASTSSQAKKSGWSSKEMPSVAGGRVGVSARQSVVAPTFTLKTSLPCRSRMVRAKSALGRAKLFGYM